MRSIRQIQSASAAQSDLIGVPEPMSIEAVLAVPNGGSERAEKNSADDLLREAGITD